MIPGKILLIDDDPTLASELERAFAAHGFSIDHATDAESGKILIETFDYSAILLDVVLPRRSGLDLLRDIGDSVAPAPVVVVSANLPDSLRNVLTSFPAVKLIVPKPIDPKALATIVAALVSAR